MFDVPLLVSPPPVGGTTRERILAFVADNPGVAKVELCQSLDIGWGTVTHHVQRLEQDGLLRKCRHKGRLALFQPDVPVGARKRLAALRDDRTRSVLRVLREHGETGLPDLVARTGLSRRALSRHLAALEEVDLVRKRGVHRPLYRVPQRAHALAARVVTRQADAHG